MIKEDSFKKRYIYKLLANLIGLPIGIVTQSIIPRGLGPSAYGSFSYLSNFFLQVFNFFEASASNAFYTKLSQRPHETGIIKYFWKIVMTVILVLLLLMFSVILIGKGATIWPNQEMFFVWIAFFWGILGWYSQTTIKIVDAYGLTRGGEIARIIQKILGLILVLIMFYYKQFSLLDFFIYNYLILLFACISWWLVLKRNKIQLFPKIRLKKEEKRKYGIEFYAYSGPLIIYATVALIVGLLDRWFLEKISGSIEQGFYGLSVQIGTICFLFTSALTPLIMRELSLAFGQKDVKKMSSLFLRYAPMMYSIAAYFSVFIFLEADKVSLLIGGGKFTGANLPIAIMAFYPIHQTYGQLTGSVFLAAGKTKLFSKIGIIFMVVGFPVTYFLLAPYKFLGLELGALGLTIKLVIMQYLGVNVQLWYTCRFLNISFRKLFVHQIYSIGIMAIAAFICKLIADYIFKSFIAAFLVSGALYSFSLVGIVFLIPALFSLNRLELTNYKLKSTVFITNMFRRH